MRVLVTEDDPALAGFLRKILTMEGYEIDLAATGQAWTERIGAQSYDLLLLDLSLPDADGTELLERLQQIESAPAVIVLTGRTQVEERIRCLDLGAEDFLLKPFSFGELTARCRAALRRRERKAEPTVRAGNLTMNRFERSLSCDGMPVALTVKEFALLEILMLRGGVCCSREELLEQIWPDSAKNGTNVVDVYINYLRRKLATAAAASGSAPESLIQTIRGSGYRLVTRDGLHSFPLSA